MIDEERADNFSKENFKRLFKEFDEDNNGYLSKPELAVLIKHVFRKSKGQLRK